MRSAAEMPVVTPRRASIDSQNAVPKLEVFCGGNERQAQVIAAFRGQCEADETAAVRGHEIDDLGRDFFRRDGQVAFVLPVLVIHDHHNPAGANVLHRLRNGNERHA